MSEDRNEQPKVCRLNPEEDCKIAKGEPCPYETANLAGITYLLGGRDLDDLLTHIGVPSDIIKQLMGRIEALKPDEGGFLPRSERLKILRAVEDTHESFLLCLGSAQEITQIQARLLDVTPVADKYLAAFVPAAFDTMLLIIRTLSNCSGPAEYDSEALYANMVGSMEALRDTPVPDFPKDTLLSVIGDELATEVTDTVCQYGRALTNLVMAAPDEVHSSILAKCEHQLEDAKTKHVGDLFNVEFRASVVELCQWENFQLNTFTEVEDMEFQAAVNRVTADRGRKYQALGKKYPGDFKSAQ